jgi:hypothetical protein
MAKKNIHIFSDINYIGYQHVNQMLERHFRCNLDLVSFYQRFYMNFPSVSIVKRLFFYLNFRSGSEKIDVTRDYGIGVFNLPPSNTILDKVNSYLVNKRVGSQRDVCITFVPSLSLHDLFVKYNCLVYYCVHDSLSQKYSKFNCEYESRLVSMSDLVFCDNETVLNRLSGNNFVDISQYNSDELKDLFLNGCKFFRVPPPVPKEFFDFKPSKQLDFDFCYFGSIHENIDSKLLLMLASSGYKVKVVSSERLGFEHENIFYWDAVSDYKVLTDYISSCKSIILPYSNSKFMSTISPAKINQVLALGIPVFCSNSLLCEKFNLLTVDDALAFNVKGFAYKNVEAMHEKNLIEKINSLIEVKYLNS